MKIRAVTIEDIETIATIALACFPNDYGSLALAEKWHRAAFTSYPKTQYFVATNEADQAVGYISWSFIGGWQSGTVELEQLGVHPDSQGQGVGKALIIETLPLVKDFLKKEIGRDLHIIKVDTATNNRAQDLYRKTLGAEVEAVFKNYLYGEDEVIMFKRFD